MVHTLLIIGLICIIISAIFIGAFPNEPRPHVQRRPDFHSETADHRHFRTKAAMILGLVGLIFFGIAGLLYIL
ncbi:hypothetical protein FLK61_27040 [Paenalkalicoccus suaedae]|uniref:Uncharacterized protein n=1 Tax=Paenalkalicoccus suaedae TaxID=2592382 RepID=A0A859FCB3_9BACI|nr:DUF5316 family protein [Paenalkalicoccus suaedae]QKS70411.1 hypothetical protein FLK61_27040 [Paenalkalicoccus suaedae]